MPLSANEARVQSSRVMNTIFVLILFALAQWLVRLGLSGNDTFKVLIGVIAFLPTIPLVFSLARPVINIVANSRGITLGRGILFHTHQLISWRDVVAIDQVEREQLIAEKHSTDQKIRIVKCVRITFTDTVGLTEKGIYNATVSANSYIIEPKNFGFGIETDQVIAVLSELKKRHTKE